MWSQEKCFIIKYFFGFQDVQYVEPGKTEMMFETIALALQQQKRVCWAIPRADVVIELVPRLKQAFP